MARDVSSPRYSGLWWHFSRVDRGVRVTPNRRRESLVPDSGACRITSWPPGRGAMGMASTLGCA
jgi:hypothetical protein